MAIAKPFELIFEGKGTASGKMRNDISVDWPAMGESFELATDEGGFHGGDGTAPPPLALFVAGLTGCIMTQIRAFARRFSIELTDVTVHTRCHWRGDPSDDGAYTGSPVGFHLDVEIDSPASQDEQLRLLEAAKKGCFLEASLTSVCTITHRLKTADGWQDA